jgi:transcription initiation factor TFIID subunit 10
VTYYLNRSGFNCPDDRVKRLIAVAAQKFVSDIASEALGIARARAQQKGKRDAAASAATDAKLVLTTEELSVAAQRHGISVKKPKYFADSPRAAAEVQASQGAAAKASPQQRK